MSYGRVLITGGATGIGFEMARQLLTCGAQRVFIGDIVKRKGERAVRDLECEFGKYSALFMKCDVAKRSDLNELFKCADRCFGGLDVVINNAGILNDVHWSREIDINLTGLIHSSFLAWKYMGINNGGCGGTLVNVSSVFGLQCIASTPVYVGTKHGVIGFSRSLAMPFNFCKTGVRVLTLCPGVTQTPMLAKAHKQTTSKLMSDQISKDLGSVPSQVAPSVAKGLIYILNCAKNGSVWVAEGGKPIYEVDIPDRETMRKCKNKLKLK